MATFDIFTMTHNERQAQWHTVNTYYPHLGWVKILSAFQKWTLIFIAPEVQALTYWLWSKLVGPIYSAYAP